MLKARIESERTAASAALNSPRSSLARILISEVEESGAVTPRSTGGEGESRRRQPDVVDEGHVFWCHGCKGNLVVL
jgi:hypothetical protein